MKQLTLIILAIFFFAGCKTSKESSYQITKNYKPDDAALYKEIVQMDSIFFNAYNHCDEQTMLDLYASIYSDSLEFYHDKGGLSTSKKETVEATKRNVCGKVTRTLVPGSIEVYPIKDFGAIEFGLHGFHNNQEPPNAHSKIGRFIAVWKKTADGWKLSRVISLH